MSGPWVALSLMPEDDFRQAAAPLFAEGQVDAVEWSFDMRWRSQRPPWLEALLDHYGAEGRLLGHGVHFSAMSARWEPRQAEWLDDFRREVAVRPYVHVSEHYGFMTADGFPRGAPLPLPQDEATLRVGRQRLALLREALRGNGLRAPVPLGIENLAIAWNRDEALAHGPFLDALLEDPTDFVLLDVHNLYCQAANFDIPATELLRSFPLQRVGEIHISGGSWQPAWRGDRGPSMRCDTHDDAVPDEVFALLEDALRLCPNARAVIFERLGDTFRDPASFEGFRSDFQRVRAIVRMRALADTAPPAVATAVPTPVPAAAPTLPGPPPSDDESLAHYQSALLGHLLHDIPADAMRARLAKDPLFDPYRRHVEAMDPRALGLAARIAKKWVRPASAAPAGKVART